VVSLFGGLIVVNKLPIVAVYRGLLNSFTIVSGPISQLQRTPYKRSLASQPLLPFSSFPLQTRYTSLVNSTSVIIVPRFDSRLTKRHSLAALSKFTKLTCRLNLPDEYFQIRFLSTHIAPVTMSSRRVTRAASSRASSVAPSEQGSVVSSATPRRKTQARLPPNANPRESTAYGATGVALPSDLIGAGDAPDLTGNLATILGDARTEHEAHTNLTVVEETVDEDEEFSPSTTSQTVRLTSLTLDK
jgi:hypothetical protein